MEFTETRVINLYDQMLADTKQRLAALQVAEGREPTASGLNGWIFEQTIRYCLERELLASGRQYEIREQVPLNGRARIDLLVGRAAIEIKARGSFGTGDAKYATYRKTAEERGWAYLYLTMQESYVPYRDATIAAFGVDRAFFLDTEGHWAGFVNSVVALQ